MFVTAHKGCKERSLVEKEKFVLQWSQRSKTREETKIMLSQMNYRKETQPHGDELFPLSVHYFETDPKSAVRVYCHWHEEVELFYAVEGEAVFHIDTETFLLKEGETAFVNANCLHEVEGIDGQKFTFLAIVFQTRFLSGMSLDRIQQKYIEPVLSSELCFPRKTEQGTCLAEKTAQAMLKMIELQKRKEPGWELLLKAELLKAWQGYYCVAEKNVGRTDASTSYRVSRMKEILTYMNEHFCEDLEIAELARQFHMSESAFCRFFKSIMHISAVTYLNNLRIAKSCRLLVASGEAISKIAGDCGFRNISYFNRVFQDRMHQTPGQFRSLSSENRVVM